MKKQSVKSLRLNKRAISILSKHTLVGGIVDWPDSAKLCPKSVRDKCPKSHLDSCEPCFETLFCGTIK